MKDWLTAGSLFVVRILIPSPSESVDRNADDVARGAGVGGAIVQGMCDHLV